jgi:hypothetical protein
MKAALTNLLHGLMVACCSVALHCDAATGDVDLSFDPVGHGQHCFFDCRAVRWENCCWRDFTTVKGLVRNRIARLNADGSVDATFNPARVAGGIGDPTVQSVAVLSDGKVLLGGGLTEVAGLKRVGVARLNADGSLDTAFNPNLGIGGTVFSLAGQPAGKVLIGGIFETVDGIAQGRLRGSTSMAADTSFDPGTGSLKPFCRWRCKPWQGRGGNS